MNFVPNTNLRLLKGVPLDKEYQNTIMFANASAQQSYFNSKLVQSFDDFTYQRLQKYCVVGVNAEQLYNVNYMMFQNTNFGNKWFYAFVTDVAYLSQTSTAITFEIDVFQTWLFDYKLMSCYVEREHVSNDSIGAHIEDEGIGYGDYITYSRVDNKNTGISDCNFVVASTRSITDPSVEDTSGGIYDGVFNGVKYYAYSSASDLKKALANFKDYTDSITAIFMAPKMLSAFEAGSHLVKESGAYNRGSFFGSRPLNFGGYVPKNNKLYTYPYTVMNVINNNGGGMALRYELFKDPTSCEIIIEGVLNKGTCLICFPNNYKGITDNREYQLTLPPYANCEWVNDVYSTWLTQNTSNIGLTTLGATGAVAYGALTGNLLAVGGGLATAMNTLANMDKQDKIPNEIRGGQGGNYMLTGARKNRFELYNQTITAQYARMIDDYFTMFGYRVARVKVPSTKSRKYWNYVKTSNAIVTGNIPTDSKNIIQNCLNKGITFWHDTDVGNYNRTNSIV